MLEATTQNMSNPFLLKPEQYVRDINVLAGYIEQQAIFLYRSTEGMTLEQCAEFVLDEITTENPINDPLFLVLEQNEEGDRVQRSYPFSFFLKDAIDRELLIAPTLSCLFPPHKKESELSIYIKGKLKQRSDEKALQYKAQREGDSFKETIHNNNQNNAKILVNAISGNHRSLFSILYDKPIHPILTSGCRIANGFANANDERFLAGMRHYYNQDIAIENISSIITLTNMDDVQACVMNHGLYVPTAEDVYALVKRSAEPYWSVREGSRQPHLWRFISNLTPMERAAVTYVGDFYHLDLFNESITREIIGALCNRPTEIVENHEEWIMKADGDTQTQVRCIYPEVMGEKTLKDDEPKQHPDFPLMGSTVKQIYDTFHKYKDLINTFWTSKNLPPVISDFPSAIRTVTVGSDTDSAIFTVQYYVKKYAKDGKGLFNHDNIILAEAMGYLVSMTTVHGLATMTTNIGVQDPFEKFRLAMKNEYLFPVFFLTSRAKHYWANMAVQEGQIFKELRREKKGVELIAGNIPDEVRADLDLLMNYAVDSVTHGKMIYLKDYLRLVAKWEYIIYDSVISGETTYLKSARVNDEDGYSQNVKNTAYINYLMWQECFADKYGDSGEPPYSALSFSIVHGTKKKTKDWLATWEDQERAKRFGDWLASRDKEYMGQFLLPESIVLTQGVPSEILDAIDVRKIVYKAMSPFYLVLESLEFYLQDSKQTRLIMDLIDREEAFKVSREDFVL